MQKKILSTFPKRIQGVLLTITAVAIFSFSVSIPCNAQDEFVSNTLSVLRTKLTNYKKPLNTVDEPDISKIVQLQETDKFLVGECYKLFGVAIDLIPLRY